MIPYYCACLCVCTCLCVYTCTNIDRLLKDTWRVVGFPLFTAPVTPHPHPGRPRTTGTSMGSWLRSNVTWDPTQSLLWKKQDNPRTMLSPCHCSASVVPTLTCFPGWRWNSSYFWVECQLAQHFSQQSHMKEIKQMLLFALFLHCRPTKGNGICRSNSKGGIRPRASSDGRATKCLGSSLLKDGDDGNYCTELFLKWYIL